MNTRMRKGIAMVLVFILTAALWVPALAAATLEAQLGPNLTITADQRMVHPGDTVTYTVGFNLKAGSISGVVSTQVVVLLPTGLNYKSSVYYVGGAPSVVTTQPIATPAGSSMVFDFNNLTMTPGLVTIYVTATVGNNVSNTGLKATAELYLLPYGTTDLTTPTEEVWYTITVLAGQTTVPITPLATPANPLIARAAPVAADISTQPAQILPTPITPQMARVEFNLAGGVRTGGGELVQSVPVGASAVAPIVVRPGYTLAGWDTPFVGVTQNIVVTARWTLDAAVTPVPPIGEIPVTPVPPIAEIPVTPITPMMSRVTFNLAGGTRIGGGELVQYIATGGSAVAPYAERAGYNFVGWDSPYGNVMHDITVTARWAAVAPPVTPVPPIAVLPPVTPVTPVASVYRVTFNLNGGVRVGGGALVQAIPDGLSAVEPYVSRSGYIFTGWDRSFNNVRRDMTVTAQWTSDPGTITVAPPIAQIVTGHWVNNKDKFIEFGHMPLIFNANSHVVNLESVDVDGRTLTAGTQYVATTATGADATTAVFLKASYLNTLSAGTHTLTLHFKGGATAVGAFTIENYTNKFLDVSPNDWFYKGVQAMNASGLLTGTTDTHFDPNASMTRGTVVTLLYKFTGEPSVAGFNNPFPDVTAGQYYTNAVIWAATNGIVTGHDTGLFAPQDLMTREQFAVVLFRYQNALGNTAMDVLMDRTYSDFSQVSTYAQSAVNKTTMQGVFRDWPVDAQNRFQPKANVTRAELAAVMRLWIESIGW